MCWRDVHRWEEERNFTEMTEAAKRTRGKRIVMLAIDVPRTVTSYDVQQAVKRLLPCVMDVEIAADYTTAKGAKLFCKDIIVCD